MEIDRVRQQALARLDIGTNLLFLLYKCAKMCIMSAKKSTNIKQVLKSHCPNTVLTAEELLRSGFSRDLQRSALRSGWLTRIGSGAFTVLNEQVSLEGAIYTLQKELNMSVHLGAYTVLNEKYGKTYNITVERKPQLFCYRGEKLPVWFIKKFESTYDLFRTSFLPINAGFIYEEQSNFTLKIPALERAILEMLYLTPSHHTLQETYQVMELLGTGKPALMQSLLEKCTSIKVKRLCLYMAEEAGLAWFKRIDLNTINLGKGDREITKNGQYNKKYKIVVGNMED